MKISMFRSWLRRQRDRRVVRRQTVTRSSASTPTPTRSRWSTRARSPVVEPGLDETARQGRRARARSARRRMRQEAVHDTDVSLICVGTPSQRNGSLNLEYLERVSRADRRSDHGRRSLPRRRRPQHGAAGHDARRGDSDARARLGQDSTAKGSASSVNPEFLREGTALKDFQKPPLTLVGHNHAMDATQTDGALSRRSTRRSSTRASASPRW